MSILVIILTIPLSIFNGWGLTKLWQWFVMPMFDVKPLSISIAIGITYIMAYLAYFPDFNKKTEKSEKVDSNQILSNLMVSQMYTFMKVCIFVSFGWIVSKFI